MYTQKRANCYIDLQTNCNMQCCQSLQMLQQVWNKLLSYVVLIMQGQLMDRRTTRCSNKTVRNKLLRACLLSSSCQQLVMRRRYQMLLVAMLFALCYKIITTCPRLVNNWPLETSSL